MGLSLARVTCETSRVLLAGDQVVFLEDLSHFHPTLRLSRLKMSEIILTARKTQMKEKFHIHIFVVKTYIRRPGYFNIHVLWSYVSLGSHNNDNPKNVAAVRGIVDFLIAVLFESIL